MELQVSKLKGVWNIEQEQRRTKIVVRLVSIMAAICLWAIASLQGAELLFLLAGILLSNKMTILIALLAAISLAVAHKRNPTLIPKHMNRAWNRPIYLALITLTALTMMEGLAFQKHSEYIDQVTTAPKEGTPWREGLTVKVYWDERIPEEARRGLADTTKVLGFQYETAATQNEANLHVWPDSWAKKCKWPSTKAFASLDRSPDIQGSQWGEIFICGFKNPFIKNELNDYSIMAHETAHILAAQPHFGDGLMAEAGGNGAHWFTEEEIKSMCEKISDYRKSLKQAPQKEKSNHMTSGNAPETTGCGAITPKGG